MSQGIFHKPDVPRSAWDRAPWNRWSFQHVAEIVPSAPILRSAGRPRPLPRREMDLDRLELTGLDGSPTALDRFLEASFTDGLLVLHGGAIVLERYFNGMDGAALHLSQSVAKSFAGVLAGIHAARGTIDLDAPIEDIMPELAVTAYRGARLRHLLDMTSGVRFTEDYDDPLSDMGRLDVASGWKPPPAGADPATAWPRSVLELVLGLRELEAEHGARFAYRSIETDVLALVLERATGKRYPQLLSDDIWLPLGMEHDAGITVDRDGFALADGGLSACLRDYGRFGQMLLERGAGLVPAAWIEATRTANHALFGAPYTAALPGGAYSRQFWVEDADRRNIMARGVFGQLIYVGFDHELVVVKLSSWPEFTNPAWTRATLAAVRRIGEAVSRSG